MCEADIDECQLGICRNGHCVNSVGTYPLLNFFFFFIYNNVKKYLFIWYNITSLK